MFKVWYRVSYFNEKFFVYRWFWQSPLAVYDKAKKKLKMSHVSLNTIHVDRIY
jgi:hypothetical protein